MEGVIDLSDPFGIPAQICRGDISVSVDALPRELITGAIRTNAGTVRCSLRYMSIINQGTYGMIQLVSRTDPSGGVLKLACKRPAKSEEHQAFGSEAIVQWLSAKAAEEAGIHGAIPMVHDIYRFGDEIRFTMDYVRGVSAYEVILHSANPDITFLQCLAQTCILLAVLEERLALDHRDLKLNNLWIRPIGDGASTTANHTVMTRIGGHTWVTSAPFQVVILDFGFACLGDKKGLARVSLGGEVYPPLDPCPKDGRDLFQCIMSLWSVQQVRAALTEELQSEILLWLHGIKDHSCFEQAKARLSWAYSMAGEKEFAIPMLRPLTLLRYMALRWPSVVGYV